MAGDQKAATVKKPAAGTKAAAGQKTPAVIAAIGAVVAAVAGAVVAGLFALGSGSGDDRPGGSSTGSSSPASTSVVSPASGKIVDPEPGQEVLSPIDVRGVASAPEDRVLWVLVKSRNNHYYTVTSDPAPVDIDTHGNWRVRTVGIGKVEDDRGHPYDLVLVAAPREGGEIERAVAEKGSRMSADLGQQLPGDAQELDRVTVTLAGSR
ncbi:hypothetical protein [Geodermatophilus siccatus]|uniref:hypothetical protein n=1 Tax=Geodermatophilus siccatus TaxID=1137991 RepID=UPI0011139919|nr:hypothetical protein [Geodermatophilus siccatus]